MPYLGCARCRLTFHSASPNGAPRKCPRCSAPLGPATTLFESELPNRLLAELDESTSQANRPKRES